MRLRETAIVSGGMLAQQAAVFVTGILIARFLGADGFGALGVLKSLAGVLVIVTPLGLDLALLKHASFYGERLGILQTLSRALRLVVVAVNLVLLAAVVVWVGPLLARIYDGIPGFAALCSITMLGLTFAADIQVSGALFRVFNRIVTYSVIVNYVQPTVRLALTFAVLLGGGGVQGVVWVNTALFAGTFVAIARADRLRRQVPAPIPGRALARDIRAVLSESLWMAMSLLVYQAIRLVDVLILAAFAGARVAGEYTAMSSVAQLIQIYPNAISQTLGPEIALAYRNGDRDGIVAALQGYLHKAGILGGYLFGGVAVFGTDLDLVFGGGFVFFWPLPLLLATGWYLSATLAPFGYVLSMTGRHRGEFAVLTAGAVLLVVCLVLLVPPFGAVGAAMAVAAVFAGVNAARCGYVIRIIGRNPLGIWDLLPPALFLLAALACRAAGSASAARSFPLLVAECAGYTALAGALGMAVLASAGERRAILRLLPGRGLPP